eukprot:TRINITY_DN6296_c0_g1_i3.p1 TRINITY_DN6296_c0_g1~~TRINITY_DN6296_c0_g1_i3.p1  ORF type:complete len:295 (+),score=45.10 TRINITY_DN6296_c0_g1_i3:72-956(+)
MIIIIDDGFLTICLIVSIVYQLLFYLPAAICKFDKVTDLAYGSNFVLVAILTLIFGETFFVRKIIATVAVSVWGLRLIGYLFYRITKIGRDERFDGTRDKPIRFFIWFMLQFIGVWLISLPLILLNSSQINPHFQWNDYFGWTLWLIGFLFEVVGDQQKSSYRSDPTNKDHWCDVGLWRYSRHPNYFGEICCWWGIFATSASVLHTWQFFSVIGPAFITLLIMFGSGIPTTEKSTDRKYGKIPEYREWKRRTPVLIPFIPNLFGGVAKTLFCCEFGIYNYAPETIAEQGLLLEE